MLDLKDALNLMESGAWFSIVYVSYDKKRDKAGSIIRIARCRLLQQDKKTSGAGVVQAAGRPDGRNPHHYEHATRNLQLANRQVRKVHIRLIFAINGQKLV